MAAGCAQRTLAARPASAALGRIAMMAGVFSGFAILQTPLGSCSPPPCSSRFRISTTCAACLFRSFRRPARRRRRICLRAFPAVALPFLVLIVIGILWVTNLYNFMDGSDGLAGGMTVTGFYVPGSRRLDERRRRLADRVRHSGSRRRRVSTVQFSSRAALHGRCRVRPIGFLAQPCLSRAGATATGRCGSRQRSLPHSSPMRLSPC